MKKEEFIKIRAWFLSYTRTFQGSDQLVNAHLGLKDRHAGRVAREMVELAADLNFSESDTILARAIGLLHDVGRYEQFKQYRTFNDAKSVDHSKLGVKVLDENRMLETLNPAEANIIRQSILFHGLLEIPENLNGRAAVFAKMVRDTDKVDIFRVVIERWREYKADPKNFKLQLDFPDLPGYSNQVIDELLNGRRINYQIMRTLNDSKLAQLGWVYDINFAATLKRMQQRKLFEQMAATLPQDETIEKVLRHLQSYMNNRLKNNENL